MLLGAALIGLLALVVGISLGHFAWRAATVVRLNPTSSRRFAPFRYVGPGGSEGSGAYGRPYGGDGGLFGPEGGSSSGEAEGGSSSGVSSSITGKVDPGLVDIDTDLGLEGASAAGTGMVVTSTGEVITNNHVITGATKITATDVGNGTTYTARVVGYDHSADIAVLQLEGAAGLKTVSLGDSASLEVGQSVATIGNAGGVGGTPSATGGRVTALDQSITAGEELDGSEEHLSGLVQLEGDVEPGDSGGPLANSSGEVLGMDTAASATFQFASSADEAYAIPINQVEAVASQIVGDHASNTVHIGATALLGVLVQSQSGEGALVESVLAGTPAASSGLAAGDVITALDGSSVASGTALTDLMLQEHPGDTVKLTWQTPAGAQQSATVKLASGPPQ